MPYGWNGWLFVPYTGSTLNPGEIHLVLVSLKFEFSQVSAWYAFSLLYLCLYLSFLPIYLVTSTMDFFFAGSLIGWRAADQLTATAVLHISLLALENRHRQRPTE